MHGDTNGFFRRPGRWGSFLAARLALQDAYERYLNQPFRFLGFPGSLIRTLFMTAFAC